MKKTLLFFVVLILTGMASFGQVVVFHEDFELPSLDDSVSYFSTPTAGFAWGINTRLHYTAGSLRSDSCQVKTGTTVYLTSPSFSTVGNTYVLFSFSQICKVDYLDIATIEASNDNGNTWSVVSGTYYMGTGQYTVNGNRFNASSYAGLWQPSSNTALPQNTWWRAETFDISSYVGNVTNARVRFKLADGGNPGPNSNKGWYLDNLKVTMAPSELIPPVITLLNPYPQSILYSLGPFTIKAKIQDQSGIDTAFVVYSINNGPDDTAGMVHLGLDTMKAVLPMVSDSDSVCWYVKAIDNSLAHNWAVNPTTSCIKFKAYGGITFPFYDPFDIVTNLWTPSYGGSNQNSTWQLGTPNFGATNSTHSPPNAWDVNLSSAYASSAYCILTSPVFDFSNAVDARMSFWLNYNTEDGWDGTRLEYTTNGTTWNLLGSIGFPGAINWYSATINATNQPAWEGNSGGWKMSKIRLSMLNNAVGQVRFRFIFNADASYNIDGFSIDDFSIVLPSPQDAGMGKILGPSLGGCGLGNDTVRVKIVNNGLNPINGNLTVSYQRDPASPIVTEPVTGTIMPNDSLLYTFSTLINLSTGANDVTYNIKVWTNLNGDPNHGDDTLVKAITSLAVPPAPTVSSVSINYGNSATITAISPNNTITWYPVPTGGTSLSTGPTYITPLLYGTTIYYPQATAPNGCTGPRAQDTVFVGAAPPFDGSTLAFIAPVTGINLTNTEIVKARIRNYGTSPMTNFLMKYSINGQAPVSETYTAVLNPSDTITYTFTTPANLSAFGNYNFKVWLEVTGDANHVNDTVTALVTNNMYPYCTSRADYTWDSDIGNVTISNLNNGNPYPTTGNANSVNLYTNFTNLTPVVLSRGQTYNITIKTIYQSSHVTCYAKVFIDWNYDGVFDEATETAFSGGPTTSSNTNFTGVIAVPVTAHLGLTRFRVVLNQTYSLLDVHPCGIYNYGETEDYNAMIMPQLPFDAAMTNIVTPAVSYPQGTTTPCEVIIKNVGLNAIDSLHVFYRLDNNPTVNLAYNTPIPTNTTANIIFPAITWPTGTHNVCAWVVLLNDSNSYNDTLCKTVIGVPVDSLPYYDNFDGVVKFTASSSTGTNWIHGAPTAGFPATAHSAPDVWATNLNISGGYTNNANCILTTQIFDFTTAINAKLSFWMNYNTEFYYDGTRLEYSLDGGITWNLLGSVGDPLGINWYTNTIYSTNQPAWAGNSNGWIKATYLLSNFNMAGTMRFRFLFNSDGSGIYNGMAIDDFQITVPYPNDAGVDSILSPIGTAVAFTQQAPLVRLVNFGSDTLHQVDIKYKINNMVPTVETWLGTLNPGASTLYQFTNPYSVPEGNYTLTVYSDLLNEQNHLNDTTKINLFGIPTFIPPYEDSFDSTLSYWYPIGTQWEHGLPTNSNINYALSPPFCWKTNLDGNYIRTGQLDFLYSPMFDFVTSGYDSLTFYHWVETQADDGGMIEYLSTTGWKKLGWMGDPFAVNWYTNNIVGWSGNGGVPGWHKSAYDLTVITDFAQPTQFRFTFTVIYPNTVAAGWAIDDFRLTSPKIPKDAGVTSIIQPVGQTTYGTDILVTVRIKNFGTDTLYTIPVKYQINGVTVNVGNWTGTLYPDNSVNYTFPPYPAPLTNYYLCAFTDLPLDTYFNNDTSCSSLIAISPDFDILVSRIINPINQTIHGDSTTVKVMIKNVGLNPVTEIPVGYTIADTMLVVNELLSLNPALDPGDSVQYDFQHRYAYDYLGYYYLCAFSDFGDDGYRKNDTLCSKLEELYLWLPENATDQFYVSQNMPNPTEGRTDIMVNLPKAGDLRFEVLNTLGQSIWRMEKKLTEGEHLITLETDKWQPGVYYYYVIFDQKKIVKKMVVTR